jgi:hypothetical protein
MAQTGTDIKKWCSFLVWTNGDFDHAKETQFALQSEVLVSWVHPPTQPECNWMIPVASEVLDEAALIKLLESYQEEYSLVWEGPYYYDKLEDDPYYPHKCENCGGPTHYKYRSIEFLHPTDYAKGINIPDDEAADAILIRLDCYGKFVYLCFQCLEGYIGDNEMTTGGTGLWMAG